MVSDYVSQELFVNRFLLSSEVRNVLRDQEDDPLKSDDEVQYFFGKENGKTLKSLFGKDLRHTTEDTANLFTKVYDLFPFCAYIEQSKSFNSSKHITFRAIKLTEDGKEIEAIIKVKVNLKNFSSNLVVWKYSSSKPNTKESEPQDIEFDSRDKGEPYYSSSKAALKTLTEELETCLKRLPSKESSTGKDSKSKSESESESKSESKSNQAGTDTTS